jgi:pyruvate carboxylase subunit B
VHTLPAFVALGQTLAGLGADELCIKDMGGFMPPGPAAELVRALRKEVGLPVVVHTHSSSGLSTLTCMAAAEAGAEAVDSAVSPFAGGTSQPPTETIVGALRGGPLATKIDLGALAELATYFRGVLEHYRPLLDLRSLQTDPGILLHQVPGGMLSNLISQLKDQEAIDRLQEVLTEIPRVRADLGYPPLVTPTSQIVGIQAVFNVLAGERYKTITQEVRDYVRGLYGQAPAPLDPDLVRKVLNGSAPISGRPADLLEPEFAKALAGVRSLVPAADDAEALSYALFPQVYKSYRAARDAGLTPEVLASAGVGIVGAFRARSQPRPPPDPARTASGEASVSPWAHEGRARLQGNRRWVDATRARARR